MRSSGARKSQKKGISVSYNVIYLPILRESTGLLVGIGNLEEVLGGDPELLEDHVTGGTETELVSTDDLTIKTDILVPQRGYTGLHGDPLCACLGQDALLVLCALAVEDLEAWHGYNTDTSAQLLGGLHAELHLGTAGKEDKLKVAGLLLDNVATLEDTLALQGNGDGEHRNDLTGEDKGGGAILAGDGGDVGT